MALIHRDVGGLYQGVSQQAPPLRLPNQFSEQFNFRSSVVRGLERRQGAKFLKQLTGCNVTKSSYSFPFRDSEGRRYWIFLTGDAQSPIEIYTLSGVRCTVSYATAEAKSYLLSGEPLSPLSDYRAASIADYTMVVNRKVRCQMKPITAPAQVPYALYWVKRGVTSTDYVLGSAKYTTADSTSSTSFSTSKICEELCKLVSGLTQLNQGSVGRITGDGVAALNCSDSYGNQASSLIKGKVTKEEDLPPCAADGDVVEITGKDNSTVSSYFVKYSLSDNLWKECAAPGIACQFDPATMPHQLIRTGELTFLFRASEKSGEYQGWEERMVGDDHTAPLPSFIGSTIRDVFYYKNRLGFLSGQNIILSRPNDYFNFFPETTAATLDTDPTDRAVGFNEPTLLEFATPYKEDLMLFSSDRQFIMTSGLEVFTSRNAMVDLLSNYPCSPLLRPMNLGNSLIFASDNGMHSLIREYFVDSESGKNDAADLTAHVPEYLPDRLSRSAVLVNHGLALYTNADFGNRLYVYSYYWSGNEKPQSAWSIWEFPFQILAMESMESVLYLLVSINNQTVLCSLDPAANRSLLGDLWVEPQLTYDAVNDVTTADYPLTLTSMDPRLHCVAYAGDRVLQEPMRAEGSTDRALRFSGDLTGCTLFCGLPFSSTATLSPLFITADGKQGMLQGTLMVRSFSLSCWEAGGFEVSGSVGRRPKLTHRFSGGIMGRTQLSTRPKFTGIHRMYLQGRASDLAITIKVAGVFPTSFDSYSFEAIYHNRTQRSQ